MFLFSNLLPAEPKGEHTELSHSNNNGPVAPTENPAEPQTTTDTSAETTEQDADDEAAEDTDDTRFVSHHNSQHLKRSGYLLRLRWYRNVFEKKGGCSTDSPFSIVSLYFLYVFLASIRVN